MLSDIKAKAIVTAAAAAHHLPGRRATDNRTENVAPTWWSILGRGYLGAWAIHTVSGLTDLLWPLPKRCPASLVVPSSARIEGKE
jgi:hypothetical protein